MFFVEEYAMPEEVYDENEAILIGIIGTTWLLEQVELVDDEKRKQVELTIKVFGA